MIKKRIFASMLLAGALFTTIAAYGATSTSFKVNNVNVTGSVSIHDGNDYNPFDPDSVTAKTTATSVMDSMTAEATIYYCSGDARYSKTRTNSGKDTREVTTTVKASALGIAYKGEGKHSAAHNNDEKSGTTLIRW